MIRVNTVVGLTILLALLCQSAVTINSKDVEIKSIERQINLQGQYPTEQIKLVARPVEDGVSVLHHLVAAEYDTKISKILFLKGKSTTQSYTYAKTTYIYDGEVYFDYKISLDKNYNVGDQIEIGIMVVYINRFVNLPESIKMAEDQKLQYSDYKYFVSPYKVISQENIYKFAKILQADANGEKKGLSVVSFKRSESQAFTLQKHIVFGVNNNPLVIFSEVEKVIEVSHWGNIAITQNYKIKNTGPTLKGQFSRVTFGSRGSQARNAYRGIDFELPYDIWGLYYRDEVGNITTSRAYRDDASNKVKVNLAPRFGILGGWNSNWEIGYNFKSEGLLFHQGHRFQMRNVKLEYALERILTEDYTLKIVLPEGSTNVQIKIGGVDYDLSNAATSLTPGYLDFVGRPTYTLKHQQGIVKDKNVVVSYDYDTTSTYKKPLVLFLVVFGILAISIFAKRFTLQAFSDQKVKNE